MTVETEKEESALAAAVRRGRPLGRDRGLAPLTFPALAWYLLFTIGPLFAMFYIAFLKWPGIIAPHSWAGLDNFTTMVGDPVFWQALRNSLVQLIVSLTLMMPTAFMIGYYVARKPRGHRTLRVFLFTSALISLSARSMVFLSIFAPNGLLNGVLSTIGLEGLARPWLADTHTALGTIIAVDLWGGIGYTAVLFSARLAGLDPEVLEAAQLDGAGHIRQIWGIAYPICRDYFGVMVMLHFIWVLFGSAGLVLLLTNGGPGNASTTLPFMVYDNAFSQNQIGYAQAIGVVTFVIGLLGILVIRRIFRPAW